MNQEETFVSRINGLLTDITNYIESNPDWIYYFLNPLAGGNEELFSCMREHPDDWNDFIDFEIADIRGPLIKIKIHVDDYTDCGITFGRYIHLLRFEETVKMNKMLYEGKMDEIRKDSIKQDITMLKEALQKKGDELKKLEK